MNLPNSFQGHHFKRAHKYGYYGEEGKWNDCTKTIPIPKCHLQETMKTQNKIWATYVSLLKVIIAKPWEKISQIRQ